MSIQGYAEGILGDVFSHEKAAHTILSEGDKMKKLVDELLYISRMDSGLETSKSLYLTSVNNLLFDCHERLRAIAEKSNKRVLIETPENEVQINTDDEKLEIVIVNILSNAIRHAETEVRIACYANENGVEIRIQDDGPGVALEDVPHMFERFYRGTKGNTGLGLAISKGVIKNLGGSIHFENLQHPQHGAMFTIRLTADI